MMKHQQGYFFTTQGGGKAIRQGYQYVWAEPPKDFPSLHIGDLVPEEWGICGPFNYKGEQIDYIKENNC